MPSPDLTYYINDLIKISKKPIAYGFFGWPIKNDHLIDLMNYGYVEVYFDWSDCKTRARLTQKGTDYIVNKTNTRKSFFSRSDNS